MVDNDLLYHVSLRQGARKGSSTGRTTLLQRWINNVDSTSQQHRVLSGREDSLSGIRAPIIQNVGNDENTVTRELVNRYLWLIDGIENAQFVMLSYKAKKQ